MTCGMDEAVLSVLPPTSVPTFRDWSIKKPAKVPKPPTDSQLKAPHGSCRKRESLRTGKPTAAIPTCTRRDILENLLSIYRAPCPSRISGCFPESSPSGPRPSPDLPGQGPDPASRKRRTEQKQNARPRNLPQRLNR